MATWTTPKTNWTTNDGIGDTDLNRMEENTEYLYDQQQGSESVFNNYVNGFHVQGNTASLSDYEVSLSGGFWVEDDGSFVQWSTPFATVTTKTLSASSWTAGSGGQAKAPGATFSTDGWYWVFALYNPTTNALDFAIDSSITGANLGTVITPAPGGSGFTQYRRICPIKTSTLLSTNGIVPMIYGSQGTYLNNTIKYFPETPCMEASQALSATTSTQVLLRDSGGNILVPRDTVANEDNGGMLEMEIITNAPTVLWVWSPVHGGITHYNGLGDRVSLDTATAVFKTGRVIIPMPTEVMRVYSSAAATLTFRIRSMTCTTDKQFYP
tara:strand:+ start:642 stop:1616 length:975 start_codon:yes stop_codon:yes gene_type:complete